MNYKEIGQKIKAKYPQYANDDDEELGRLYAAKFLEDSQALVSTTYLPPVSLQLPPLLEAKLNEAVLGGDPSFFLGWFKRLQINSRTKTLASQASEIRAVAGLIQSYADVYRQAAENQRLPQTLSRLHNLEDLQYREAVLQLDTAYRTAFLADCLIQEALKAGLPLEAYLLKLNQQLLLEYRQSEINQDVDKARRLKEMDREDELLKARNEIETLTTAKLAQRQQEKQLRDELRAAYHREEELLVSDKSERLKQKLLEEARDEIESLKKKIDEYSKDPGKTDTGEES